MYYELLKKDGESATLTKDGKHYTVKGTVRGSDSQGTDGMIKPFRSTSHAPDGKQHLPHVSHSANWP